MAGEKLPSEAGIVREFPHDRRSDADLVRDVAAGHEEAVTVVWRRYSAHVRRTLRAALGHDPNIDDLLQEVFVSFVRNAANVREPERLRAYLAGAAIRQARQNIRGLTRKRRSMDALQKELGSPTTGPNVGDRDGLRRLQSILDALPDRLREAFVLRFVEDLPAREVADCMGSSLATAKRDIAKSQERVLTKARRDPALVHYLRHRGSEQQAEPADSINAPGSGPERAGLSADSVQARSAMSSSPFEGDPS